MILPNLGLSLTMTKKYDLQNLSDHGVHLWYAPLTLSDTTLSQLTDKVSAAEIAAANRRLKKDAQQKYIASKAITRDILSRYLNTKPLEIDYVLGSHGKPELLNQALQFNVSHAGDWMVLAITKTVAVGVDIEYGVRNVDYQALAKRFFAQSERAAIKNATDFYRCWTRKEAFIKATGLGLSFGLSNFAVSVLEISSSISALLSIHGDVALAAEWSVQSVPLIEGLPQDYRVSIATRGPLKNINCYFYEYY